MNFTEKEVRDIMKIIDCKMGFIDHEIGRTLCHSKGKVDFPFDSYLRRISKLINEFDKIHGKEIPSYFIRYYKHIIKLIEQEKNTHQIEWLDRDRQAVHNLILLYAGETKGSLWDKNFQETINNALRAEEVKE